VYDGNNNNVVSRLQAAGGGGNNYYDFLVTNSANSNGVGLFIKEGAVTRMRFDGSGNIGIGTTAPSTTLTVSGTQLNTSWTAINMNRLAVTPLEVSGTISATALVINGQTITGGASGDRITSGTSSVVVNSTTSTISFTTAGSQRMTIDGSGNVGIGTASPQARLHVVTSAANDVAFFQNTNLSGWNGLSLYNSAGSQVGFFSSGNASASTWPGNVALGTANGTANLVLATNNIERLRVDPSGNVGIGTTAPSETLHVSGTTRLVSNVAIGTPSATLDVSGTMRLSDGSGAEVCDTAHYGFLRVDPATGELQRCVQ
jgi:hypothetical protein